MNLSLWCAWYLVGDLAVPKLTASESAALIMLAATILVFRTFRERFLLVWSLGWLAYAASQWFAADPTGAPATPELLGISRAAFVLAVCLFAASILLYTHTERYILPLFVVTGTVMAYAVARVLYWPDEVTARVPFELAYRAITIATAVQLIRYRWGRLEIGPWLVSASLLFLHLDWPGVTSEVPNGVFLMADLLLGLGMLFMVFDDARARTKRLGVMNSLTTAIGKTQQHGPMMQAALEQLKKLMHAKAAWFGTFDGDQVTISNHIGVSQEFLKGANLIHLDESVRKVLAESKPAVVTASETMPAVQDYLVDEKLDHVVLVPVHGKRDQSGRWRWGRRMPVRILPRTWTSSIPARASWESRSRICGWESRCCAPSGNG